MDFKNVRTILFDYDGTLHDTMKIYPKAFKKAFNYLVENDYVEPYDWSDEEIQSFLGVPPHEMWNVFGKDLDAEIKDQAAHILRASLFSSIKNNEAELYDWADDVLKTLKGRGYELVFISNCQNYYLHAHTQAFSLGRYFDYMVCSESYPGVNHKEDVLEKLKPQLLKDMVIVGDKTYDIKAGKQNNIQTIGVKYGYGTPGELEDADYTIDTILDLLDIFKKAPSI